MDHGVWEPREDSPDKGFVVERRFTIFDNHEEYPETASKDVTKEGEKGAEPMAYDLCSYLDTGKAIGDDNMPGFRLIYVEDDATAFDDLVRRLGIHFPRARSSFRDWGLSGTSSIHLQQPSTEQTAFWRPAYDLGKLYSAFGLDYLNFQIPSHATFDPRTPQGLKLQNPGNNVSTSSLQRLSIYIQQCIHRSRQGSRDSQGSQGDTAAPFDDRISTILVFNTAHNASDSEPLLSDTTLSRDLPCQIEIDEVLLSFSPLTTSKILLYDIDNEMYFSFSPLITSTIQLVFEAVAIKWSDYIYGMHAYVSALENQIYTDPANDTHTTSVWNVSKQLLQAERLLKFHILLLENLQSDLLPNQEDGWLRPNLQDFRRLFSEVEETLRKPVAQMVDLIYKSISIRDTRQSLELNTSLWRLSWITFIFLPLTFLSSFFGMNVSVFHADPDLKWYFIVAVPLMIAVLLAWLSAKGFMRRPLDREFLFWGEGK